MIPRKYFKTENAYQRQVYLCPEAKEVLEYAVYTACPAAGIDNPTVTDTVSTYEEDQSCGRKHDQHRRRVAFDIRVKDWSGESIDAVENDLDAKFSHYSYINGSGQKEIAYCHGKGDNIHFHVAVNARYKLPEISNLA